MLISLVLAAPAFAHHSTAPFDMSKAVTVTGTVTKFVWENPHSYIYMDVQDEPGTIQRWRMEIDAVNALVRYGWTRDSLKSGDRISCIGARAKDLSEFEQKCFTVQFPDGRKLVATPFGEPPEPAAPPHSGR